MIKQFRSKNNVWCSKCKKYAPKKEFKDSKGKICNDCFKPYLEIINAEIGSILVYTSQNIKGGGMEELEMCDKAVKNGYLWSVLCRQIESKNKGVKVLLSYLKIK